MWRDFLGELEQTYPGNRVVFSCRTLDYSVLLSPRERPVRQVRIESLSNAQVEEFLTLYCPEHGAALWQNLKDTPQLDLLRSPYYLKLLVAQTTTGDIPAGRAALFTGFVRQALQREVQGGTGCFSLVPWCIIAMWSASVQHTPGHRLRCPKVVPCFRS